MNKTSDQSLPDETVLTPEEKNERAVHWAVCKVFQHFERSFPSLEVFKREYDPQNPYAFYKEYGILVAFELVRCLQDEHMRKGNPYVDEPSRITYAQALVLPTVVPAVAP